MSSAAVVIGTLRVNDSSLARMSPLKHVLKTIFLVQVLLYNFLTTVFDREYRTNYHFKTCTSK